jgi:pimeloyl-ACP methyl ester carboxylesterase
VRRIAMLDVPHPSESFHELGNGWYQAFERDIEDLRAYEKVTTPVLGLVAPWASAQVKAAITRVATDVRIRVIPDSGHFLTEERPEAVLAELTSFLG